jgi:O-antigen/teichoic acid export membrane protein
MNIEKASLKVFSSSSFNTIVGFLGITFFARELGANQMGAFFLFEALLGMLALVVDFGLAGAVEKRISEGMPGEEILGTALAVKLIPVGVIAVAMLFAADAVNAYLGAELAVLLLVGLVLRELAETQQMVLSGEQRVGDTAVPDAARQVAWVGVGAVLVVVGFGVSGLVYGLFVGWTVMFLWSWHRSETSIGRPTVRSWWALYDFSKYHVVSKVQGYFYSWVDVVIIGLFLSQAAVGAYEVAWRITEAVVLLSNSVALAVLPKISEWHAEGNTDRIGRLISNAIVPSVILVIPALGGMIVLSTDVLSIVFGQEYAIASLVLVILSGEKVFQALYRLFHRGLHGIDRPDLAARTVVVTLLMNVLLNVVLVQFYGIEGIAIATTTSFIFGTFLHWRDLSSTVPIQFPVREVGWCLFSAAVMTLGVWRLHRAFPVSSFLALSLTVFAGVLLYGALVSTYGTLRRRLWQNVRALLS